MTTNEKLYKEKYRIKSIRYEEWDYTSNGLYYVTICTLGMTKYFGKVNDGKMILNDLGKVAQSFWVDIPKHFHFVQPDVFIVMPNHIHGIVVIDKMVNVETCHGKSNTKPLMRKFAQPIPNSLSSIINQYKSSVTRKIRKSGSKNFTWLPRYYDSIIRSWNQLDVKREYILNNPQKWDFDKNNLN